MNIVSVEKHSVDELFEGLRKVTLLKLPDIKIYRSADLSTKIVDTDTIYPAQRYVLTSELRKVQELKWELSRYGIDLYRLHGYVTMEIEGYDEPIDVLPPIVECTTMVNKMPLLNDGMHRTFLARCEWENIEVVYIEENVPTYETFTEDRYPMTAFPYYAYPLVNGWDGVEIREDIPETYIKKFHRIKDYKSLYRNFNSAFNNVGGPRGNFSK